MRPSLEERSRVVGVLRALAIGLVKCRGLTSFAYGKLLKRAGISESFGFRCDVGLAPLPEKGKVKASRGGKR